jgi:hypothetical protein
MKYHEIRYPFAASEFSNGAKLDNGSLYLTLSSKKDSVSHDQYMFSLLYGTEILNSDPYA